jgi:hypothetical protein
MRINRVLACRCRRRWLGATPHPPLLQYPTPPASSDQPARARGREYHRVSTRGKALLKAACVAFLGVIVASEPWTACRGGFAMESPSEPPLPLAAGRRMLLCSVRHAEAHCIRRRSAIQHHRCHCCRHSYRQTGWLHVPPPASGISARARRTSRRNAPADSVSVRASVALCKLGSAEAPPVLHPLR